MKRSLLVLYLLSGFLFSFGKDSGASLDSLANNQIKSRLSDYFMPKRYHSNINIMLDGYPSNEDSLIFKELVGKLNSVVKVRRVALVPYGTSNLVVEINIPGREKEMNKIIGSQNNNGSEIVKRTVVLNLPEKMKFDERRKVIYYYILRSLVVLKNREWGAVPVPGSIFTEGKPENITFHPVDLKIIEKIYSKEVEDRYQYRNQIQTPISGWKEQIIYLLYFLSFSLSLSLLIFFVAKWKFNNHHYQFLPFVKQGMLVVLAFIVYNVTFLFVGVFNFPKTESYPVILTYTILGSFVFGIIAIILIFIIERALLKGKDNTLLKILVPWLTSLIVIIILSLLIMEIHSPLKLNSGSRTNLSYILPVITTARGFVLMVGVGRALYIYMVLQSENIIRKKDLELAKMNELQRQAELQSLRAKINPHFLHNALNSIASLAHTDAQKTEQMALALSDFFKYAINRDQKQLNTIAEELNATRTYLEIEKVRFGDRLTFEIECPAEISEIQIPQLLIQPLVENAIKHGLSKITEKGSIQISIIKQGNYLQIRVYDNGPSFPEEPITGFGIRNTQERISLLYGEKASINWVNGKAKYVEIRLPL